MGKEYTREEMQVFFEHKPHIVKASTEMHTAFFDYYAGKGEAQTVLSAAAAVVAEMALLADDPAIYESKKKTVEPSKNVLTFLEMASEAICMASTQAMLKSPTFEETVEQARQNAEKPFALLVDPYYDPKRSPEYQAADFRDIILGIAEKNNLLPWERAACCVVVAMNMAYMAMEHVNPPVFTHEMARETMIGMAFRRPLAKEEIPPVPASKVDQSVPVRMVAQNIASLAMAASRQILRGTPDENEVMAIMCFAAGVTGSLMGKAATKAALAENTATATGLIPSATENFFRDLYPSFVGACGHPMTRAEPAPRYNEIEAEATKLWDVTALTEGTPMEVLEGNAGVTTPFKVSEQLKSHIDNITQSENLGLWQTASAFAASTLMIIAEKQDSVSKPLILKTAMFEAITASCRVNLSEGFGPNRSDASLHAWTGNSGKKPTVN